MQFSAPRRTGKTYGKANKNVRVHDLFEYRTGEDDTSSRASLSASPAPAIDVTIKSIPQGNISTSEISEPKTTPSLLLDANGSDKHIASESKRSLIQDTSLFDMKSSDEDDSTDTSGSRASKRRRTVKSLKQQQTKSQELPEQALLKKANIEAHGRLKKDAANKIGLMDSRQQLQEIARGEPTKATTGRLKMASRTQAPQRKPIKPKPLPRVGKKEELVTQAYTDDGVQLADHSATDASDYLSDRSRLSPTWSKDISKEKQPSPAPTESDFSSPSHLGLTALKIEATGLSSGRISPDVSSDGSSSRKKIRRRLIDRLDVPSKTTDRVSEDHTSDASTKSSSTKVAKRTLHQSKISRSQSSKQQVQQSAIIADDSQHSQTRRNLTAKPRATYATQRSHLSDMVDGLDGLDGSSSQKSVDEVMLPVPTSHVASQLELEEEDSDNQAASGRLKSIHELRQAGVNNRFDREIDALLEDIDFGNHSSKALRLQSLMKLSSKLREPTFSRHLASSGRIQRLISFANQSMDPITSTLLVNAYLSLARSEDVPVNTLGQLFRATMELASDMLVDDRPISKVAKDRKQNLSRATVNDLAEFERSIIPAAELPTSSFALSPDLVALSCLECSLRKMVQLGKTSAKVSTAVYVNILGMLESQVQHLQDENMGSVNLKKVEVALSLLELCSIVVNDADLHVADEQYRLLGDALAELIHRTGNLPESLEKSVLRVVVSLSNNKPRMCQHLGPTGINKATFDIINNNFLNLAKQADTEQELDQDKLDSVVLALGCLLNFAECDSSLRGRLAQTRPGEENHIDQLVSIFNSQVSKVDEAMTKEQSQISVAFGYLSMLLCTLSLHPTIKSHVTQSLKDRSFEELCTAAEKFFSHLRTLEHMSEDDASMASFTARFSAILDTIRASRA